MYGNDAEHLSKLQLICKKGAPFENISSKYYEVVSTGSDANAIRAGAFIYAI